MMLMGGGVKETYLLRDEFTTNEDAPLTSPRTCEPGPGAWNVTDTSNYMSIGADGLTFANSVGTYNPQVEASAEVGNAENGLCFYIRIKSTSSGKWLYYYQKSPGVIGSVRATGGNIYINGGEGMDETPTDSAFHDWFIINCSEGQLFIVDSELIWASRFASVKKLIPVISAYSTGSAATIRSVRAVKLPAPWDDYYNLTTAMVASPSTGEVINHTVNALVEFTWICNTGEAIDFMVRRTDDDNCWIVRATQSDGSVKIIEKVGGTETERANVTYTFLNTGGYRFCVRVDGTNIVVMSSLGLNPQTKLVSYATMTTGLTATTSKITGFTTGENFISWPRDISGAAGIGELAKIKSD